MTAQTPGPSMRDYVHQSPEAIRRAQRLIAGEVTRVVAQIPFAVTRVDLVGSGTSLHAGIAVRAAFEKALGVEVRVWAPNEYCHDALDRVGPGTLVLGVSQTGRSTATNRAMRLARGRGAFAILVTGWPDAVGAADADTVLDILCGEEVVGARTKGYVATLFALHQLWLAVTGRAVSSPAALPDELAAVIAEAETAVPRIADDFAGADAVWIVSYGSGMATAREAALKLIETVRVPVLAYDVEEYMHGPYHCLEPDTRLVYVAPAGPELPRLEALSRFVAAVSGHTLAVGGPEQLRGVQATHRFVVSTDLEPCYHPILHIPVLQLLAVELTERAGREPGASRYPEFHDVLASKAPPSA